MGQFLKINFIMPNLFELMILAYKNYVAVYVLQNIPINNNLCHLIPPTTISSLFPPFSIFPTYFLEVYLCSIISSVFQTEIFQSDALP